LFSTDRENCEVTEYEILPENDKFKFNEQGDIIVKVDKEFKENFKIKAKTAFGLVPAAI
jgi:hypothetical protein